MDAKVAHALNRFGFGPRASEAPPTDPVGWLNAQIAGPDTAQFSKDLPTVADGLTLVREQRRLKQNFIGAALQQDALAQSIELTTTQAPFRERLVWFWANHFTVSTRQGEVASVVGPFVREAIRPHVTGPFFEMLLAVIRHPAMLMYLDNISSVGPDSFIGRRGHRGLNENLARECMELHTLGADGGYTQADVTAFAAVLTGWSVDIDTLQPGFVFSPEKHQPGPKTMMGGVYPPGDAGGVLALYFLAHHPSTYRHLATKLVRHFVADEPPPDAVRLVEARLRDTQGNLGEAALALVQLPQAWVPATKFRTPFDFVIATRRLLDYLPPDKPPLINQLISVAQPLWNAPLPNGWPDRAADWTSPDGMIRRIDWSYFMAGHLGGRDPVAIATDTLGPTLRPATLVAMRNAGSRRDALALLLSSPEFQRR